MCLTQVGFNCRKVISDQLYVCVAVSQSSEKRTGSLGCGSNPVTLCFIRILVLESMQLGKFKYTDFNGLTYN